MNIQTSHKFPKLSSESPVNRLKSLSPIHHLSKTRNSASQNSGKLLIIQKTKALNQNNSLASKYFLQDLVKSSTPKTSSISQSLQIGRVKSKRKTSNFENLNSWLVFEELKLIQSKKPRESLSDLQSEFLLYKDYLGRLAELSFDSSPDFRASHQKALEKIVKIFGKVLRRSAQSDSVLVPVFQQKETKNVKVLKSCQVQTEIRFFLDDDEEEQSFMVLKTLNEKLKNVKLNQVIDKLIDLKQSIVDMHSFVPLEGLKPEISAEAYNGLLRLFLLRNSRGKTDAMVQTDNDIEDFHHSLEVNQIELNKLINDFDEEQTKLIEAKSQLEDLSKENLELTSKLQEFEMKEKLYLENNEKNSFEMTKVLQNYSKSMENLEKALFENMKKLELIQNIWKKVTGSDFKYEEIESNSLKATFFRANRRNSNEVIVETQTYHEIHNRHRNSHEDAKEKDEKRCKFCQNQQISSHKSFQIFQEKHNLNELSDLDQQFKSCLSENQSGLFEDFKIKHFQLIQKSILETLEKNSKGIQTNIEKNLSLGKNQLFVNETPKKNLALDHQSIQNEFETIVKESEAQAFLFKLFGTMETSELPIILKSHLLTLISAHLSKKCGTDCSHLKRAMMLKKIHLLAPYPISKIHL